MTTKWPKCSRVFFGALRDVSDTVLNGTFIAFDPSIGSRDSKPGYAIFERGAVQISGTLNIDHRASLYDRIKALRDSIWRALPEAPALLVIEDIPGGLGNRTLLWAAAVTISAVDATQTVEVPIAFWRAHAVPRGYQKVKGMDHLDAIAMGEAVVAWCREQAEGAA